MKGFVALAVLLIASAVSAATVGDLNSANNDLSWMVSVSRPWDGTNADLNGQLTDTLPADVPATVTFKPGTFPGGTYRGWLHAGDFVFYRVAEVVPCHGEWRELIRAGRCGNPATGRYFVPKPAPPPPCAPPISIPPPPPPPPPLPPPPCPPPVIKVECPPCPCPVCPAPVINLSCPIPERIQYQPHAGAQIVHTRSAGANVAYGYETGGTNFCRDGVAPPFPYAR